MLNEPWPSFENTIEGNYWSTKENYTMGTNKRHIVSFFFFAFQEGQKCFHQTVTEKEKQSDGVSLSEAHILISYVLDLKYGCNQKSTTAHQRKLN